MSIAFGPRRRRDRERVGSGRGCGDRPVAMKVLSRGSRNHGSSESMPQKIALQWVISAAMVASNGPTNVLLSSVGGSAIDQLRSKLLRGLMAMGLACPNPRAKWFSF